MATLSPSVRSLSNLSSFSICTTRSLIFSFIHSHYIDRLPLCRYCSRRSCLQRFRLFCSQTRPSLGASLVLSYCQYLYHRDEPQPHAQFCWFLPSKCFLSAKLSLLFFRCSFSLLLCQQISKLSMIPVVCIMEWILHGKHYSREVKTAVMVVVIGVGVCTVTDVKVNLKGFVCACLAVVSSSLQQIVSVFQCFYFNLLYHGVTCIDVES